MLEADGNLVTKGFKLATQSSVRSLSLTPIWIGEFVEAVGRGDALRSTAVGVAATIRHAELADEETIALRAFAVL
jgi:hypothetical protein